jgi:hypothetical protein
MAEIDSLAAAVKSAASDYVKAWKALRHEPISDEQRTILKGRLATDETHLLERVGELIGKVVQAR